MKASVEIEENVDYEHAVNYYLEVKNMFGGLELKWQSHG